MRDASFPDVNEELPEPLPRDPFPLLVEWFARAMAGRVQPNPDAMALATVSASGLPSVRIVLAKRIDPVAGTVDFYTNYRSRKSQDLEARPFAAAVFHWDSLSRQARVEGPVTRTTEEESDAYFRSRPWPRKIGAWASEQSRPIGSRADLLLRAADTMARFGLKPLDLPPPEAGAPVEIPRPPHWGGWRIRASRVELWCGSASRIHDRAEWTRDLSPGRDRVTGGPWSATRLQP